MSAHVYSHQCARSNHRADPASNGCLTCQMRVAVEHTKDTVSIPTPTDETLECLVAHPSTLMRWVGNLLVIANPNFPPMVGQFRTVQHTVSEAEDGERIHELHIHKGNGAVTISKDLHARLRMLMFRICDESVPLFSSDRLKTLHRDCGDALEELDKQAKEKDNG